MSIDSNQEDEYVYEETDTWMSSLSRTKGGSTSRSRGVGAQKIFAKQKAAELESNGYVLEPVASKSKTVATTFWGQSWCQNINNYEDYFYRLPQGRSALKNEMVIDLKIKHLQAEALIIDQEVIEVKITFKKIAEEKWKALLKGSKGHVTEMAAVFSGEFSDDFLALITEPNEGVFPHPDEISMDCNCLDHADVCRHVAAVLYGIGVRLDSRPELFFKMRGVDPIELVQQSQKEVMEVIEVNRSDFDGDSIRELFDIDVILD